MRNSLKLDGPVKTYLDENELPKAWYNVRADMKKKPAPLLNPGTGKPVTFEDLQPVFCDELIKQHRVLLHHGPARNPIRLVQASLQLRPNAP